MYVKASLHFHSNDDPHHAHSIRYNLYEGIDEAARRGFRVLASTCHRAHVCTKQHRAYARERGVLLIPGIEADIYDETGKRSHVLILNCTPSVESVRTFDDLREYRHNNPNVFTIAAHPYYPGGFSLGANLERHIDLFDAIEHSWFYTKHFNPNQRAAAMAQRHGKPLIATSDTHYFDFMDEGYVTVDVPKLDTEAFFAAIRAGRYQNTCSPRAFWREVVRKVAWHVVYDEGGNLLRKLINPLKQGNPAFAYAPEQVKKPKR